jgi:hypothetical protein
MPKFTFWQQECEECGTKLDTYEDEYMEVEQNILCKECFEDEYGEETEENDGEAKSINFGQAGNIKVSQPKTAKVKPAGGNSKAVPDFDSSTWGMDEENSVPPDESIENMQKQLEKKVEQKRERFRKMMKRREGQDERNEACSLKAPSMVSKDVWAKKKVILPEKSTNDVVNQWLDDEDGYEYDEMIFANARQTGMSLLMAECFINTVRWSQRNREKITDILSENDKDE